MSNVSRQQKIADRLAARRAPQNGVQNGPNLPEPVDTSMSPLRSHGHPGIIPRVPTRTASPIPNCTAIHDDPDSLFRTLSEIPPTKIVSLTSGFDRKPNHLVKRVNESGSTAVTVGLSQHPWAQVPTLPALRNPLVLYSGNVSEAIITLANGASSSAGLFDQIIMGPNLLDSAQIFSIMSARAHQLLKPGGILVYLTSNFRLAEKYRQEVKASICSPNDVVGLFEIDLKTKTISEENPETRKPHILDADEVSDILFFTNTLRLSKRDPAYAVYAMRSLNESAS